jgi:nicotinamide mononucleotide transporter
MNTVIEIGFLKTSILEVIAVAFGLACVWCMKKESILAYPFGIVNVLIYVYIFFSIKVYANAGINLFFGIMSGYGWYIWARKTGTEEKIQISWLSRKALFIYFGAVIVFFVILRLSLVKYTDSTVPTWDAVTTAFYIIGSWLLAYKKIENWYAWIIGDVISIGLYVYLGLYFTSFQYLVFSIIAVLGFLEWKRKEKERGMRVAT